MAFARSLSGLAVAAPSTRGQLGQALALSLIHIYSEEGMRLVNL